MSSSALNTVTLPALAAFLLKNEWIERSGKKRLTFHTGHEYLSENEINFRVFEKKLAEHDEPIRIIIRLLSSGEGNQEDLYNALKTLSAIEENTSSTQIARQIAGIDYDTLCGIYPRSKITLAKAHEIISELRNLFTQTANAEENPEPYLPDPKANSVINDIFFGHTFAGSFGFKVECPVTEGKQILIGQPAIKPIERRLLERLAIGFKKTEEYEKEHNVLALRDSYIEAFNANICDALVNLASTSDDAPLKISFSWSSMFPEKKELSGKSLNFELNARKVAFIKEVSDALKSLVKPPATIFIGTIFGLSSDVPPLQMGLIAHRKITIHVHGGDYDKLKMQLEVSDADYRAAFEAHGAGKLIELKGQPKQRGTHWRIEGYSDFKTL